MEKHHVIISGTGRAGTTFLVQLLTELGLDTGFDSPQMGVYANCRAGMERDLRSPDAPYIVKDPRLCDYLDDVMERGGIVIDVALVPIRDLFSAAESRRSITEKTSIEEYPDGIPGGLWSTESPQAQEQVLAEKLYNLTYALTRWEIPTTFLLFPRFVQEGGYLYRQIGSLFGGIDERRFFAAFEKIARPELVSDFVPNDAAPLLT